MAVGVEPGGVPAPRDPADRGTVPGFRVEVEEAPGGPLLRVSGELDVLAAPALEAALLLAERGDAAGPVPGRCVTVDLAGVVFADCSGTRPLRRAARRLVEAGGRLVLRHPCPEVALVLVHQGLGPGGALGEPGGQPASGRPSRAATRSVST